MPTYGKENFKESNVNYLNKDFKIKTSLMNYLNLIFQIPIVILMKHHWYDVIGNERYVGDVLSFYIDQQYQEMLLPLAKKKKHNHNGKMFGYKVKPIVPSYVDLTLHQMLMRKW